MGGRRPGPLDCLVQPFFVEVEELRVAPGLYYLTHRFDQVT